MGLGEEDRGYTDDRGDGLYDSGELPVEEAASPGLTLAPEGHGNRRPLGEILQPDADGEGYRRAQCSPGEHCVMPASHRPEGDPMVRPGMLSSVMAETRSTAPPAGVDTLGLGYLQARVQMGQHPVEQPQEHPPAANL